MNAFRNLLAADSRLSDRAQCSRELIQQILGALSTNPAC